MSRIREYLDAVAHYEAVKRLHGPMRATPAPSLDEAAADAQFKLTDLIMNEILIGGVPSEFPESTS